MSEVLDIVDQNDKVIETGIRSQIYKKGLGKNKYIRYVNVLLFNKKGLLLLPRRTANREIFPNCYDFSCGTHLKTGESYDEATIRGMQKELGIQNPNLELLGKLTPREGVSGFMQIYKIVSDKESFDFNKNEIQSLEWHKIKDIVKMINEDPSQFKGDLLPVLKWHLARK